MKLILIVEDEYGNAEVLQLLLEAEGYRVCAASNGKAALDLLQTELPALILSDFMMPVMNGAELGSIVRKNPDMGRIPFVFMSATSEDVVRRVFDDYDAFLVKPFDLDSMLALVKRLVTDGRPADGADRKAGDSMRQFLDGLRVPPGS